MTKTELLNRFAKDPESRILLARALDQLDLARHRAVPVHTGFLTPAQQSLLRDLLEWMREERYFFFGGFSDAERQICVFLPDWQTEEAFLSQEEGPIRAVQARYPREAELTHRDFLGALMGLGLTREKLGDLLVERGVCHVLVLEEQLPTLLSQWESVGRWSVELEQVALGGLSLPEQETRLIRDTVASLRLDAVIATGFSLPRAKAAALISQGKVMVNHKLVEKSEKLVQEGDVFFCRGLGKCSLTRVAGRSKKDRILLELERYL